MIFLFSWTCSVFPHFFPDCSQYLLIFPFFPPFSRACGAGPSAARRRRRRRSRRCCGSTGSCSNKRTGSNWDGLGASESYWDPLGASECSLGGTGSDQAGFWGGFQAFIEPRSMPELPWSPQRSLGGIGGHSGAVSSHSHPHLGPGLVQQLRDDLALSQRHLRALGQSWGAPGGSAVTGTPKIPGFSPKIPGICSPCRRHSRTCWAS